MVRNELVKEILELDTADREYIRDVVLASLAEDLPPQLSESDQQEILRRIQDYETNPDSFKSWADVKKQLAESRAGRR